MGKVKETWRLMRKALVYYVAGAPEYTSLMDELTIRCTDAQWEKVCRMLDEADDFLGESDIGTLYQKEMLLAKQEKRPSRTPSIFDVDETRERKLEVLRKEFKRKGIPFRE